MILFPSRLLHIIMRSVSWKGLWKSSNSVPSYSSENTKAQSCEDSAKGTQDKRTQSLHVYKHCLSGQKNFKH